MPTARPLHRPPPYLAAQGRRLGGCGVGGGSVRHPQGRAGGGWGLVHAARHQPCAGTAQGSAMRDQAGARAERDPLPAPYTPVPSHSPWWGPHVAAVQLPRTTSSHPAHSQGAPAPAAMAEMGLGKWGQCWGTPSVMGDTLNTGLKGPRTLPARRCRQPPHAGLPSALSPSPSCPQRVSNGPWRRLCCWG